jgi:hypothetical protein
MGAVTDVLTASRTICPLSAIGYRLLAIRAERSA